MSQVAFQYRAIDRTGARSRGEVSAVDRTEAYRQLSAAGLRPLKLKPSRRRRHAKAISLKDLSHLTYQLAVLMEAHIPIVDGLRSIGEQEPNENLQRVIADVARRIEAGSNVTEALLPYKDVFGEVYVETIRAAELSGNLIDVLNKLADMLERQYETNRAVKGAMMYPICVIATLVIAVGVLMIFVVPQFSEMFASRGIDLPVPTKILVAVSGFLRGWWHMLIGSFFLAVLFVRRTWGDPVKRRRIDTWLHHVPVLRDILRGFAVSRFAHVFGLTLRSGLSLIDALEIAGLASGRPLLIADTQKMQEQVKEGGRLSDVLTQCSYMPGFARRLLTAGEEAAELTRMSEIVARHYDREVAHMTKNITTVIEPIMIVGLAGIVLIVALAIFLPMWNMAALIG